MDLVGVETVSFAKFDSDLGAFGGGGYFIVAPRGRRHSREGDDTCRMVAVSVGRSEDTLKATFTRSLQARPTRPSDDCFRRLRRQPDVRPNVMVAWSGA